MSIDTEEKKEKRIKEYNEKMRKRMRPRVEHKKIFENLSMMYGVKSITEMSNQMTDLKLEEFGLVKGQHVAGHTRIDSRTGKKFFAGKGGVGSPEKVLVEGKTVAPNVKKIGDIAGVGENPMVDPSAFIPEESVYFIIQIQLKQC
jgi:hypothetical protein